MSRYLPAILILSLLIGGCATKEGVSPAQSGTEHPVFAQENDYIIEALYYRNHGQYAKAQALFETLYRKTGKIEYAVEAARMQIAGGRYAEAAKTLKGLLGERPDDPDLWRLLSVAELKLDRIDEALKSARKLLKLEPDNPANVDLLASIELLKGRVNEAYRVYETFYRDHHDSEIVVKMASILYHRLKAPDRAIRLLESHSKMVGCSQDVCLFLAELYRQNNDLEHLADTYARLYEATKNSEFAQKAAEIYAYKKRFDAAEKLLVRSHADDRLLLAIYKHTRQFAKGAKLAKKLYEETMDPVWEAEYGVLLYESAGKKKEPRLLHEVVEALESALKEGVDDPLYLNYLGYLLIDHDLDIPRGIELVKRALAVEPDSDYYLDSLAWGYYKLGRCDKAYPVMKRVVDDLGLKEPEIAEHWKKIKACRSRKK